MTDELLIRFITKECSPEECRQILHWIESEDINKKRFTQLQAIWTAIELEYTSTHEKADPEEVRLIMSKLQKKRKRRWLLPSVAAAVAAAILLFIFTPFKEYNTSDYEKALASITPEKEVTLTVHQPRKQQKIEIADTSITVANTVKGEILVNDSVKMVEHEKNTLNTIHVPYGRRSKVILADGTIVHLNSGSSLVYPTVFATNKREVYLDGEAYFEVTKSENQKFIVQTAYKAVEVLGTQFNVSIDKELHRFETVLVSGKIALETSSGKVELEPNQFYGFSEGIGTEEFKNVDITNYISWVEGSLKFSKEPLHAVIHKLEKVYNIKITLLKKEYINYQVSGNLNLKNSSEETLNNLMSILVPNYDPKDQKFYKITQVTN